MTALSIRKVRIDELPALLQFSKQTFFDAFYHLNNPEDMKAYADKYFTISQFQNEFGNPLSHFYFAMWGDEIAGYIKLNFGAAQSDLQDETALEVERIYVSAAHQGKQIGKQMLDLATRIAIESKLQYLWLGVFEKNHRAIKFYQQNGFQQFASHDFLLGGDLQRDVLMKKTLPGLSTEEER
ncbi:MAG: GNAT family N-acetyltransferase [Bacteroidota bacterium]